VERKLFFWAGLVFFFAKLTCYGVASCEEFSLDVAELSPDLVADQDEAVNETLIVHVLDDGESLQANGSQQPCNEGGSGDAVVRQPQSKLTMRTACSRRFASATVSDRTASRARVVMVGMPIGSLRSQS
jgi:hypothetical protein